MNVSDWDCTLEAVAGTPNRPAVRLGLRQVKGLGQADAERVVAARAAFGPAATVDQLQARTRLGASTIRLLAEADAFASLARPRRALVWDAMALDNGRAGLVDGRAGLVDGHEPPADLLPQAVPPMRGMDEVLTDYATTGLSLKRHPVAFVRDELARHRVVPAGELRDAKRFPHGHTVSVAGLVLVRQRPGTASGVVFITLEDETGTANLILWSTVYERYRRAARHATLLQATGRVQREGGVIHVLGFRLLDQSDLLRGVVQPARNFH